MKWQPTPVFLPGEPHGLGSQRVGHDLVTDTFKPALICDCLGSMPLVCSENPHTNHIIEDRVYNL